MIRTILLLLVAFGGLSSFTPDPTYTIKELLDVMDTRVNQEVKVKGSIVHICEHSGKKCFLVGNDVKTSLEIVAGGDITAFSQDDVGSEVVITGIVKERRMDMAEIENCEKEALEHMQEDGESHKQCQKKLVNAKMMREWMETNNKDYYVTYYIEGIKYQVID